MSTTKPTAEYAADVAAMRAELSRMYSADMAKLRAQVAQLTADLDRLTREYVETNTTITNAWAALNRAGFQSPVDGVAELIDQMSAELEQLRTQLAEYADDNRAVVAQLTAANHHADNLAGENRSLQQAQTAYANENARLRTLLAEQQADGERRCQNCAPGYDCERGIYTPEVAR